MSRSPLLLFPATVVLLASACADEVTGPVRLPANPLTVVSSSVGTTVMSGLNSPRGLSFGPEGGMYVAEGGTARTTSACVDFLEGLTPATKCWSGTGSISRLWRGKQERVATGLPSTYIRTSGLSAGPQDISFMGRGHAMVALGWGGPPALRATMGGAA